MNRSMQVLSFKQHIQDVKEKQSKLTTRRRALIEAKNALARKVVANHHYRQQCQDDIHQLRVLALRPQVYQIIGERRVFNADEMYSLTQSLSKIKSLPLSWSLNFVNGVAKVTSSFNHLVPVLTFYPTNSGEYLLHSFSVDVENGGHHFMEKLFY